MQPPQDVQPALTPLVQVVCVASPVQPNLSVKYCISCNHFIQLQKLSMVSVIDTYVYDHIQGLVWFLEQSYVKMALSVNEKLQEALRAQSDL